MVRRLGQLRHTFGHPVEEPVLVVLFGSVGLTRMDVGGHEGEKRTVTEAEVRLHPSTGSIEVPVVAESFTHRLGFGAGHHGDAGSALGLGIMADRGVARVGEDAVRDIVRGAHLLEGDEVRFRGIDPGGHPLSPCCADSVDVD